MSASTRALSGPAAPPAPTPGWRRFSAAGPDGLGLPDTVATYGAAIPDETTLRLLGPMEGRRVLDLGCGAGRAAVAFARAGARVIAVDPAHDQLDLARQAADEAGVRIELQQAELAELAFVRADGIDVAFSAYALAEVADVDRVFRQVNRVLKPEAAIVLSLPHPTFTLVDPTSDDPLLVRRPYHDDDPATSARGGARVTDHRRTVSALFTSLTRANFRVDTLLEPTADRGTTADAYWSDVMAWLPPTLVMRARKQGL